MTPSASGSLKGTPTSTASAPPSSSARTMPGVASGSGQQPGTKAISAGRPSARVRSNSSAMRSLIGWSLQAPHSRKSSVATNATLLTPACAAIVVQIEPDSS